LKQFLKLVLKRPRSCSLSWSRIYFWNGFWND
jgi:hypothetical protein